MMNVTGEHECLQAATEPPWADNCSMEIGAWKRLSDCLATLALRNAALETLLEASTVTRARLLFCPDAHRGLPF